MVVNRHFSKNMKNVAPSNFDYTYLISPIYSKVFQNLYIFLWCTLLYSLVYGKIKEKRRPCICF